MVSGEEEQQKRKVTLKKGTPLISPPYLFLHVHSCPYSYHIYIVSVVLVMMPRFHLCKLDRPLAPLNSPYVSQYLGDAIRPRRRMRYNEGQ